MYTRNVLRLRIQVLLLLVADTVINVHEQSNNKQAGNNEAKSCQLKLCSRMTPSPKKYYVYPIPISLQKSIA